MISPLDPIDKWHMARWTKFTASEIYKLLTGGKKPGEVFGEGAMTYIKTKALEMATEIQERPELEEVKSLLWGKVHEYPSYEWYINHTKNYSVKYLGNETPLFLEYEAIPKEAGGSPDFISLTEAASIDLGVEAKCPKNSMYHFDRLKWSSQWDIKQYYPSCYAQMQKLLMITGAPQWEFLSFDDRFREYKNKGKIITVKPDRQFQDNLHLRITMAVKEKYRIFNEHMNN